MKAEISFGWIIAIVVIIAIGGTSYYFTNGFTNFPFVSGQIVNGCQATTDSSNNLLIPLMGYYECAPAQGGQIADNVVISVGSSGQYFNLCAINTPSCQINYDGNGGSLTFCDSSQVNTGTFGNLYCTTSRTMPSSLSINSNGLYSKIFVPPSSFLGPIGATLQRTYTPFTLWQTTPSSGRTQVYQTSVYQCSPPGSSKLCTGDTTSQYCTKGIYHGSLTFYETSNYFDKLVVGPLSANTYNYNGQTVYGAGSTLYSIGKVTLSDGSCYSVPGSVVANVACLPGAISGGQQCGTDFQWHIISTSVGSTSPTPQCLGDFQCPGQGNYLVDFSDPLRKTAVKYSCQSGQCVLTNKVVSDCANSNACPTGTVCSLDPSTGKGSCLQSGSANSGLPGRITGILCPDGVTTVTDSSQCPKSNAGNVPWSIIFAVLGAALAFFIIAKDDIINREFGGDSAIGIVVAILIGIVIWWVVENWVSIAVSLGIAAILGGIGLYFFGGIFLALAITIGAIIRTLRGG